MSHVPRRQLLHVAAALLAAPFVAVAQPRTKPYLIGFLTVEPDEIFRQSMRDLGYVEGRDFVIDIRTTDGRSDRLDELSLDLVRKKVDVIVAQYPAAVLSARRASATIPIVMMNTPDPVQLGLVASLAKPGGNVTGLTTLTLDMSIKQLELLREVVPRASRFALLWNPDNPWHPMAVKSLQARSGSLGLHLQILELRRPDAVDSAFQAMSTGRAEAVLVLADPMFTVLRRRITELAIERRLPLMGNVPGYAETGALMSYWADRADLSRRAASYVDRILKGAKPGDLPIEQPTKFEFVINLKIANIIGIKVPQSVLLRADRVIE